MTAQCPSCGAPSDGLLCATETIRLQYALREVPSVVEDLEVALAKQAKLGGDGSPGLARERSGMGFGASDELTALALALSVWANAFTKPQRWTATAAAASITYHLDDARKHPDVDKLMLEITGSVESAKQFVLGPANRTVIHVGPCPEPDEHGRPCMGDVRAYIPRQDRAGRMTCKNNSEHTWPSNQWLTATRRILALKEASA